MPTHLELLRGRCYTLDGVPLGVYIEETMVPSGDGCDIVALKFKRDGVDVIFEDFDCDSQFEEVPCPTMSGRSAAATVGRSASGSSTGRSTSEERFNANMRRAIEASRVSAFSSVGRSASGSASARSPSVERFDANTRRAIEASRIMPARGPVAPARVMMQPIPTGMSGHKRMERTPSAPTSTPINRVAESRKRAKPGEKPSVDLECPVCMESFAEIEPVTIKCGHTLCRECLERSLARKDECPVCKATGIAPASQYKTNPFVREVAKFFKQGGTRRNRRTRRTRRT